AFGSHLPALPQRDSFLLLAGAQVAIVSIGTDHDKATSSDSLSALTQRSAAHYRARRNM
ncbi:MAG: hypothetical protein, partial [Olavius algarvensis Gamma 3 endosymbiont]